MTEDFDIESNLVENLTYHTYDFHIPDTLVDVKKAWELDGSVYSVMMHQLEHQLHDDCWEHSPLECGHLEPHWSLTLLADLSYPLIVTFRPGRDDYWVVDGRHRLLKAWLLGHQTVNVKFIPYQKLIDEAGVSRDMVEGRVVEVKLD